MKLVDKLIKNDATFAETDQRDAMHVQVEILTPPFRLLRALQKKANP